MIYKKDRNLSYFKINDYQDVSFVSIMEQINPESKEEHPDFEI